MTTSSAGTEGSRPTKAQALGRRADFKHIYEHGKRYRGKYLTAVVVARSGLESPSHTGCRAAYVISRKVAKQAVRRNRLRRRLREALRNLMRAHGAIEGWDIILIAAPRAMEAEYADLYGELRTLLGRAGVWTPARETPEGPARHSPQDEGG